MKINYKDNNAYMTEFESFNISHILECGQCFRFYKTDNNKYTIIAYKKELVVEQKDNVVIFYNTTEEEFTNIWINYFDLNRNYDVIKKNLSKNDVIMKKAIEHGNGIRILNQEPFECLISFIISQNNRIPMIQKVLENISIMFGDKINNYYSFPTIKQLENVSEEEFRECKAGFRSKYIIDGIKKIKSEEVNLEDIRKLSNENLQNILMTIKGVGPKVSDCVMLFAYDRVDAFPVDVWVRRIMEYFYFKEEKTDVKTIQEFADNNFEGNAGFAQQYLFYYAREKKIGK